MHLSSERIHCVLKELSEKEETCVERISWGILRIVEEGKSNSSRCVGGNEGTVTVRKMNDAANILDISVSFALKYDGIRDFRASNGWEE